MKHKLRLLLFFLSLLTLHCSSLTPAPVSDETCLTYSIKDEFNTASICSLCFKKGPRGLLELIVTQRDTVRGAPSPREKSPGLFDTTEPVVSPDADGRVLASRFLKRRGGARLVLNEFGPPWLPPYQLTRGHRFDLGARFGTAVVDTVLTWRGKKVCVVTIGGKESTISGTCYYSAATGILFNSRVINSSTRYYSPDSVATLVLSASNIPGI